MPQGFTKSPSYSQTLKADLDDIQLSGGSTLLQYVDDFLLYLLSQASLQEDSIRLLKLFALKGHRVSKEKLSLLKLRFDIWGT